MEDYYVLGTIIGTHALKGEVKVISSTDFKEERYKLGNTLYIEKNKTMIPVKIKSHRIHKEYDLLSFEDYNDINAVEQFIKCKLYVHASQQEELDDDEYYYHELIGLECFAEGAKLGVVKDLVNYGASDILIIEADDRKEIMIPFVDDFIEEVDLENNCIKLILIEGILGHEN